MKAKLTNDERYVPAVVRISRHFRCVLTIKTKPVWETMDGEASNLLVDYFSLGGCTMDIIRALESFIVRHQLESLSRLGQVLEFIKDQFQAEMLLDVIIWEDNTFTVRGKQDAHMALPICLIAYIG